MARVGVAALRSVLVAGALAFTASSAWAQSSSALIASLDSAARAHVESEIIPGVSVAVVRGGETLLKRGYGYVDVEWGVTTPANAEVSYEIGSVTKQFTSAAILLLAEEGKLDLDAEFTDYLDYDTRGRRVTVRRLLDHTSGIRSYTEMPVFGELTPQKLPRDTLVRLVEQVPFDFEPGTSLIYNNSAFFFLGLIVEEVSGQPYEDFVAERLFGPAGMEDSYYCSEALTREHRAHGYDAVRPDMIIRARYLDHTWPFAAGSLCSTVGDLARWNEALHGGAILDEASYRAMTSPAPLLDGTEIRYAMGIMSEEVGGRRVIAHGGGINGFLSHLAWYPDEQLTVAVLQNSTGPFGPELLANALADLVLGAPVAPPPQTFSGSLAELSGTYVGPARGQIMEMVVSSQGGDLSLTEGEEEPKTPAYRGGLRWDDGNTHFIFVRDGGGVAELRVDTGAGHYVLKRVER